MVPQHEGVLPGRLPKHPCIPGDYVLLTSMVVGRPCKEPVGRKKHLHG